MNDYYNYLREEGYLALYQDTEAPEQFFAVTTEHKIETFVFRPDGYSGWSLELPDGGILEFVSSKHKLPSNLKLIANDHFVLSETPV